ncbi:Positive regulator of purine utilization [Penicillium rolfsii]|nr:Positive regulator of purine utilization [Penicillium rolfsii]
MNTPQRSRNRAACRRCQRRKIRCNGETPSCAACIKANVPCVNDGKQEVNRTYIANLQRRVQWLESLVRGQGTNVSLEDGPPLDANEYANVGIFDFEEGSRSAVVMASPRQGQPSPIENTQRNRTQSRQAHEIGLVSLPSGGEARYIGPSSGYFLANLVFSNAGRRSRPPGNRSVDEPISLSAELFNTPALLPSRKEDAVELSSKYFSTFHLLYPFLHEPSHMQRLERMYTEDSAAKPDPSDAFHVYMVLAIAASDLSRRFRLRLPAEGYYTAATQYFETACAEGSLESLQSQLLLMVYALHSPSCGVNVWSLNYQCLGALIDLGLQRDIRTSSSFRVSFLEQEMRTRIFWVVYGFDRTLGTMMGRPIGVRDEACELRLPSDIADRHLADALPGEASHDVAPSHITYSIHLFKLARLNSEIKYVMHSICRDPPEYAYPPISDIHEWQRDMIGRLKLWHTDIPRAANMTSIAKLCETKYHEMMILVLRPSPGIPDPSEELLAQCFHHAVELIRGFGELYKRESLLYSRLAVHSIFLDTLIMLHCLWRLPQIASQVQIDDLVADTGIGMNILSSIGEHWAEARRARDCIHELSSATVQRLLRLRALEVSPRTQPAASTMRHPRTYTSDEAPGSALPDQVDSAIDIAPSTASFPEGPDFGLDNSNWVDDSMPSGFLDFSGIPNFDGIIQQYLDPNAVMWN